MDEDNIQVCGIVMPISGVDECSDSHWTEMLNIITDAIEDAGFEGNLVSHADDVGIIHKRIIQNLHDNPVVVCDVSCKNPNVMFELGLRLAFDKPTIIIKDDKTSYLFDTSAIEHLEYPRDLRFSQIVDFKRKLTEKIKATHKKATTDPNYTTFLKHFGEFKVAKLDKKEVSGQEYIIDELKNLRKSINRIERTSVSKYIHRNNVQSDIDLCLEDVDETDLKDKIELISSNLAVQNVDLYEMSPGHLHLSVGVHSGFSVDELESDIRKIVGRRRSKRTQRHPLTFNSDISAI